MSQNLFTPNFQQNTNKEQLPQSVTKDALSTALLRISRLLLVGFVFVLPLFFVPGLWATLGFQKVLLALGVVTAAVIVLSLLMLRQNKVSSVVPFAWLSFIVFVGVSGVSAVLSNSPGEAFRGSVIETGTVAFSLILLGVMTLPLVLQQSKRYTMLLFQAFALSAAALLFYVVVRLFLGPVAAFNSFGAVTTSSVGGFNDLAVFAGLAILFSLLTMLLLPLRPLFQGLLVAVVSLSLLVLIAANFLFVWLVVGFFGLLLLLYIVSKDRLFIDVETTPVDEFSPNWILTAVTVVVCLVSAWFIVLGDSAASIGNQLFGVEYLEVRPSFSATVDIAKAVYAEDLLFGSGPNQFTPAWRLHKDPAINSTLFWDTDFTAGSGYVSTLAVTTGVVGLITFALFQALYVLYGVRLLFMARSSDLFWYFVAAVSFVSATFLWLMSYLYVPGHTLLLLAALFTGITFAAGAAITPARTLQIKLVTNRQRGFGLMALAILLITGSIGTALTVGQQYQAYATFNKAQASSESIQEIDQQAAVAYGQYQDDVFLGIRSRIALLEMNELLAIAEPSEADQQQFVATSERALALANLAIEASPETPDHYAVLSAVFNNLALAGVDGALARSTSSLESAVQIDPYNPVYALLEAQMSAQRGDAVATRAALEEALFLKGNFTEALYLLAQLDIAEGNAEAAIATTEAIISLEPTNPTRYYQLGILQTAIGETEAAFAAYSAALQLDPQYANARYLRALLLIESDQPEAALTELQIVLEDNPDNQQLIALIGQIESGAELIAPTQDAVEVPVSEQSPDQIDDTVVSPVVPDSDLLTPLNTVPESDASDTDSVSLESDSSEGAQE